MTVSAQLHYEIVDTPARLEIALQAMAASEAIALDTESNSFHHYPEQLCLIQVATPRRIYIIDALSVNDLSPLGSVLSDASIMKVLHGADYDVRSLDRHYGFRIRNLYDTSISARFTGVTQFGLAAIIRDLMGIAIAKSKRLQLTDWGRRPISPAALDYAATDVLHLLTLQGILAGRLQSLGRAAWVAEECGRLETMRHTAPDPETAFLSVKGADQLDPRSLAVLRSLFLFREKEARRWRRPPFFVMPDIALISLAASPTTTNLDVPGLGPTGLQRLERGIREALRDGLAAAPVYRSPPAPYIRPGHAQMQRLSCLKSWRASLGAALSLDPSLLWPTPSLERLARAPDTHDVEIASPDVRQWQRDEFGDSLLICLKQMPRPHTDPPGR